MYLSTFRAKSAIFLAGTQKSYFLGFSRHQPSACASFRRSKGSFRLFLFVPDLSGNKGFLDASALDENGLIKDSHSVRLLAPDSVAKSENPSPTAGLHTILGQFLDETPTFPYANPYGHTIVEAGFIPPQADINSLRRADCHSLISACNYLIFKKISLFSTGWNLHSESRLDYYDGK